MERIYIDADEARLTPCGFSHVDLEMYDGRKFSDLEPRRLFPLSGLRRYITLLDEDQKEVAVIRNLDTLMPDSRKAVEDCLDEYYMIPKISKFLDRTEKYGILKYRVETNLGERQFEIRNRQHDIKALFDGRILIRDADDNRYEVPDISKLDRKSSALINQDL